jgi:hypothetical protein
MIVNKGVTVLAVAVDEKPYRVLVEGPDGRHQVCDIDAFWMRTGGKPKRLDHPALADTFSFRVLGFNAQGEEVETRYDAKLEGLSAPLPRQNDGTFGTRAANRMNNNLKANAARIPAVFDIGGNHGKI